MSENPYSPIVLKLRQIAAWQDKTLHCDTCGGDPMVAALPSLHRNAVWKAGQVEMIWESHAFSFMTGSMTGTPTQKQSASGLRGGTALEADSEKETASTFAPPSSILDDASDANDRSAGNLC